MLNTTYETVVSILEKNKEARADDNVLVALYIRLICPDLAEKSIASALMNWTETGLPSIESITRCRRKAQANHLHLRPAETTRAKRKSQMDNFIDWNRRH